MLQRKRQALTKLGHLSLKVDAIQAIEPTLTLPDLGAEGWNTQLFRSIDSSERRMSRLLSHIKLRCLCHLPHPSLLLYCALCLLNVQVVGCPCHVAFQSIDRHTPPTLC